MGQTVQDDEVDDSSSDEEHDGFWVDDGLAKADRPSTSEELEALGRALVAAGYETVMIDGDEWSMEAWGLSPWGLFDHPSLEEELSAWAGEGMTDHSVGLHTIGDHWFESTDGEFTHLGRFDGIEAAAAASSRFGVSPGGHIVLGDRGVADPHLALLADAGIDVSDPDGLDSDEDLSSWAVLDSELVDDLELVELLELVAGHGLSAEEVAVLDRRWRARYAPDLDDLDDPDDWDDLDDPTSDVPALGELLFRAIRLSLVGDLPISDAIQLVVDGDEMKLAEHRSPVDALLIGAEPIEVTRRWVANDCELRGVTTAAALEARIAAYRSLQDHMAVWAEAILEIDDGDGFRGAVEVARDSDVTLALVTAANPMAVELPPEENERRNALLADEFHPPLRSVGRSPDGTWEEAGFAMRFGPLAIQAAQHFGQAAIYRVSPDGVDVVVLVGADPEDLA